MKQNVYFFSHIGLDFIKIGMTRNNDVSDRFKAFCTYSPTGGKIVGVIKTDDALLLEQTIHKELSSYRVSGEFFNITEDRALQIIRKHSKDSQIELMNEFFIMVSLADDIDLDLLKSQLKKIKLSHISKNKVFDINNYVSKENADCYVSASQILEYIKSKDADTALSTRSVGLGLRRNGFIRKSVKSQGVSSYKYLLSFI